MPAWDEISPTTERDARTVRPVVTIALIALHAAGFLLVAGSHLLKPLAGIAPTLAYSHVEALSGRVWQFATYTFVHPVEPIPAILWLVLGLYLLYDRGRALERDLGRARLLALYSGATVWGAAAHSTYQVAATSPVPALDFAGPVFALLLVHALRTPDRTTLFLLVIPLRALTAAWVAGAMLLAGGILFLEYGMSPFALAGSALFAIAMAKIEPRLDRRLDEWGARRQRAAFVEEVELRREVDRLLAKISSEGLDALTPIERRTLKRASRLMGSREEPRD